MEKQTNLIQERITTLALQTVSDIKCAFLYFLIVN